MKKLALFLCALAFTTLLESAAPKKSHPVSSLSKPALVTYMWYEDPELTVPTGTAWDVTSELNHLRSYFPGYVFSTTHSMGLYEFEYGYYPGWTIVKIYSDM